MRRRLWVAGAVLVVLVLAIGGFVRWRGGDGTAFASAVEKAPAGTQRASWTDWSAVRAQERAHLTADSSTAELRRFLTRAFDDDLSSTSALVTSAPVLLQRYGFSPANADWELFSQSDQGAVVMLHLPAADLDAVATTSAPSGTSSPRTPAACGTAGPTSSRGSPRV